MIDKFTDLLQELASLIQIPLEPDKNHACLLRIDNLYEVQLQLDEQEQNLLFGSKICEVPPGKFRENVLKNALKYNALPPPIYGFLGYIKKTDTLSLFSFLSIHSIDGKKIFSHLDGFLQVVIAWEKAIKTNAAAPHSLFPSSPTTSIFNIKP